MRETVTLIIHALLVFVVLTVWLITAWTIDQYLLLRFPLEGLALVNFRILETIKRLSSIFEKGRRRRARGQPAAAQALISVRYLQGRRIPIRGSREFLSL